MAGNRYQVKATLIKLVYKSVVYPLNLSITSTPITVVPGRATRATLQLDRSYLPADERSIVSSQVTFWDAWGNLVEDSSPVFFSLKGFSSLIWGDSAYTIKGIAKNQQRAGFLPNSYGIVRILSPNEGGTESETTEGETLEIELDDVREVRLLPLVPLNVKVTVDQTTLTVGMGETAIVIAKVTDIFGRPVPDGTPVYWFSSAGSVTPRETTTSDGIAITTLSTASTNPLVHERFADGQSVKEKVLITATVPGNFVGCAEVVFARNPYLLTVRPRHLLLAGDVIGNGLMDQQGEILPDGYEQIEEVVWVEDEGVVIQTSIPYYASTILDIWGNPNEEVKVKVLSDLVALLDGAERKSEVKIQLNNEGYGKVILVSTGKLAGLEANVEVIVTSEKTSQPSTPVIAASATRQGKAVIKLTAKKVFARLLGLACRLTGWRGVWRTLGSLLAIGDIITFLYEVGKVLPGGKEPDWVNLGFAAASLVTSVSSVTGAGAVAEFVVNIADLLQRAFRRLGGVRGMEFAAELVKVFQELLSKWDDAKGLAMARLLDGLLAVDDQTIGAVVRIVGKGHFKHLMEISQKLEVAELRKLMGKLKAIGETYGDGIARKVLSVLWKLDKAVVKELVTSPTAIEDIATILKGGGIRSIVQLRDVLADKYGILFTNSTFRREDLLRRVATVVNARMDNKKEPIKGLDLVFEELTKDNYNCVKGAVYELQVAEKKVNEGKLVKELRKGIRTTSGDTDIDIVLEDGTFIQAKAWKRVSGSKEVIRKFGALIAKYRKENPSAAIVFVFGCPENLVDERVKTYLKAKGVIIEYLEYIGP
jgi:hypothetical protein